MRRIAVMMHQRLRVDVTSAASRRRFFLSRAARLNTRGAGSDMHALMEMPRTKIGVSCLVEMTFGDVPALLIGAHAAAVYAPERFTKDVDYFVAPDRYEDARACLIAGEWKQTRTLIFPNAGLGLHESSWIPRGGGAEVDLITSKQPWAHEAFAAPTMHSANGDRVISLAYLVLMKLDSARAIDQADLSRILGRVSPEALEDII